METNFWKFNIVVTKLHEEDAQLKALGVVTTKGTQEDRLVPYYLNKTSQISSVRQSWVVFRGDHKDCMLVSFVPKGGTELEESPPLVISSEDFFKMIESI